MTSSIATSPVARLGLGIRPQPTPCCNGECVLQGRNTMLDYMAYQECHHCTYWSYKAADFKRHLEKYHKEEIDSDVEDDIEDSEGDENDSGINMNASSDSDETSSLKSVSSSSGKIRRRRSSNSSQRRQSRRYKLRIAKTDLSGVLRCPDCDYWTYKSSQLKSHIIRHS